jgi:hypothetical protein
MLAHSPAGHLTSSTWSEIFGALHLNLPQFARVRGKFKKNILLKFSTFQTILNTIHFCDLRQLSDPIGQPLVGEKYVKVRKNSGKYFQNTASTWL